MKKRNIQFTVIIIGIIFTNLSCKKFLEIPNPNNSLVEEVVFNSDEVATSSLLSAYSSLANSGFSAGSIQGVTSICGLSADEFINYSPAYSEFYENRIAPENTTIETSLWGTMYKNIYITNAILEGLTKPNGVSEKVNRQLKGEALFIRAFNYFYLVNLFGSVPIHLTTDYRLNLVAKQNQASEVYNQIINDLKEAEGLLTDDYISVERIRANQGAVRALLARVYLYTQDWNNAEKYSSLVISKSNMYNLSTLDGAFLKNNSEAIWQLMQPASSANPNTQEGALFILTATPTMIALRNDFVATAFEPNDKRKSSWVKSITTNTGTYYYPFKYKVKTSTVVTEYSMVLRLAEQYLIRAEAHAEQNNLASSIEDLDVIRNRAGLPLIKATNPGITKQNLVNAIIQERRVEFFAEWGHRWLDLKRRGQATAVLGILKSNWQETDVLYPIPFNEIGRNINIIQNKGY